MNAELGTSNAEQGKARGPGDWVRVVHEGQLCVGTVMDLVAGAAEPKRVRIQRGPLQGNVIVPSQYRMVGWLDEAPEGE